MKHLSTVLLGLCVATVSVASHKKNIPSALLYLGKPIDPYFCQNTDKNNPDDLDLKTCEEGYNEYYKEGKSVQLDDKNKDYIGYSYKYPDDEGSCDYKIFDAGKDQYWLDQSCSHVGGDHEITGVINLVKRKNNTTLQSQYVIGGGDCRALGGDFCSTIIKYNKDGLLVNMSIGLLSMLSENFLFENKKPQYLQSNDITNIDNIAKVIAFYKINVSDPVNPQFQYLKLQDEALMVDTNNANAESLSKAEQSEDINECFDNLRDSFIFKGKTKLNKAETKEFLQTFVDVCVTAKRAQSS